MKNYSATDLAGDERFILWVKRGSEDKALDIYWENWLKENQHLKNEFFEAVRIVKELSEIENPKDIKQLVWDRIDLSIKTEKENKVIALSPNHGFSLKTIYKIAAIISFIAVCTVTVWKLSDTDKLETSVFASKGEYENVQNDPKVIILPDGSSVILYENTTLSVSANFNEKDRKVILSGKAYFEVKKDPTKPFYVQSSGLTTRVLGTSFLIDAYATQNAKIKVNTGRVSVYQSESNEIDIIVLVENESAELDRESLKLSKLDSDQSNIDQTYYQNDFILENQSLASVFEMIEVKYGVTVDFDKEKLKDCNLNASLIGIPLEDKMRLICKASNLDYTMNGRKFFITGNGCR